jgi:hypothetical protein
LRWALSKGPNWVGVPPPLSMAIYTFSALQQQFHPQDVCDQTLLSTPICLLHTFNNREKWFFHLFKTLRKSTSRSPFSSFTKLLQFLNSFIPLCRSLMLSFLLFVASSFILCSDIPSFYSWSVRWLHILHCSDYPHLVHSDPVPTAN